MGTNNVDNPSSNFQYRTVSKRFIHPDFDRYTLEYDVALLKLSTPFAITDHVRTICVPTNKMSFSAGKSCIAAGWGTRGENGKFMSLES